MIKISGKPVLQYEIESLSAQGLTEIIITVGYIAEHIMNYFGDGSQFGVGIEYVVENIPLGNAGALFRFTRDRKLTDVKNNIVKMKNLRKKQRAVFLDRDGTINEYVGFLSDLDEFRLLPGV